MAAEIEGHPDNVAPGEDPKHKMIMVMMMMICCLMFFCDNLQNLFSNLRSNPVRNSHRQEVDD